MKLVTVISEVKMVYYYKIIIINKYFHVQYFSKLPRLNPKLR